MSRESAPVRAAKHLASECPVARQNPSLNVTKEEMDAVVRDINSRKGPRVAASAPGPARADDGTTERLKALTSEVLTLREEVKKSDDLTRSLERARAVQRKMLPSELPEVPGYDFGDVFRECDHVSGDFYDVITISRGRIGMLLGDVSGHGLEAALIMGMAKKAFTLRAQQELPPDEVVRRVNGDVFPDLEQGTFITAAFSVLDPATHEMSFVRAGHNEALLWRAATRMIQLVKPPGMMLGVDAGPRFNKALGAETIVLQPGDTVVQFTDGVTEAMNAKNDEFGIERLTDAMLRAGGSPAEVMLGSITQALDKFTGLRAQEDDITLIAVRRVP